MNDSPRLTVDNLEPWNGNIVDLTMIDGSHRVGLLKRLDKHRVMLKTGRGEPKLPDDGIVQINETTMVSRAWRN